MPNAYVQVGAKIAKSAENLGQYILNMNLDFFLSFYAHGFFSKLLLLLSFRAGKAFVDRGS